MEKYILNRLNLSQNSLSSSSSSLLNLIGTFDNSNIITPWINQIISINLKQMHGINTNNTTTTTTTNSNNNKYPRWEFSLLFLIPIGTVWGNVFVCLAVYLERRLRHRFNLFLVSLAISDLLCALLVMPVSAWNMIMGRNTSDITLCLVWYSLDIFFTATTIIHLCNISLGRYLALRRPFGSIRTINHNVLNSLTFRIILSWLVSFCIAGPLFYFALKQQDKQTHSINQPPSLDKQSDWLMIVNNTNREYKKNGKTQPEASYKGCGPNDPIFTLTAIGVTFVLPLVIMIVTYFLTVNTLSKHMKQIQHMKLCTIRNMCTKSYERIGNHHYAFHLPLSPNPTHAYHQNNQHLIVHNNNRHHHHHHHHSNNSKTAFQNTDANEKNDNYQNTNQHDSNFYNKKLTPLEKTNQTQMYSNKWIEEKHVPISNNQDSPYLKHKNRSNVKTNLPIFDSLNCKDDDTNVNNSKNHNLVFVFPFENEIMVNCKNKDYTGHESSIISLNNESTNHVNLVTENDVQIELETPMIQRNINKSINNDDHEQEFPKQSDTKFKQLLSWKLRSFMSKPSQQTNPKLGSENGDSDGDARKKRDKNPHLQNPSPNRLTIDRIHKGKRAVRVIGVLFVMFITCYLPFFIVYIIDVLCASCTNWTNPVMSYLEWLGYLSSMLNPFVYHVFNPIFRKTFRRMICYICCGWWCLGRPKSGSNYDYISCCGSNRDKHNHYATWRRKIRL